MEDRSAAQRLAGKVALVTGASKSIGQGLAIGLAAAGARLAVNYKTDAIGAQTTCTRIRQAGGEAEAFQTDFAEVVNTNLRGPFFGSAAAARKMIAQGGGSIINISSCAAKVIIPHHSHFGFSQDRRRG